MPSPRSAGHQSNAFRLGRVFATEPIKQLLGFLGGFGVTNGGVCKWHVGATPFFVFRVAPNVAPIYPQMSIDSAVSYWTQTNKKASNYAGFWTLLELLGCSNGGGQGT